MESDTIQENIFTWENESKFVWMILKNPTSTSKDIIIT